MGFRTQRQYATSIRSYEDVKEAVRRNKEQFAKYDLTPEDDKGNFTFYLRKYPGVRIQITSKNRFLKLHGLKPKKFLLDLKVVRELTSLLSEDYPHGIDFKLDKETNSWRDKDEIIKELEGRLELHDYMDEWRRLGTFDDVMKEIWDVTKKDPELHNNFAELGNNFVAQTLCEDGFRCKPNGFLKFHVTNGPLRLQRVRMQELFVKILLTSGFLPKIQVAHTHGRTQNSFSRFL